MQLLTASSAATYLGQPRASVLFDVGNVVQTAAAECHVRAHVGITALSDGIYWRLIKRYWID